MGAIACSLRCVKCFCPTKKEPLLREPTYDEKQQKLLTNKKYNTMSDEELSQDIHNRCHSIKEMMRRGATFYRGKSNYQIRQEFASRSHNERDREMRSKISLEYFP